MNYYEITFVLEPLLPAREVLVAELAELPFESFAETANGVKAYIPESAFDMAFLEDLMVQGMPDQKVALEVILIEDENWNAKWESNFDPIWVTDQMIIRAPFHAQPPGVTYDILIEPKMSFGTGHHATTFLVAQAMLDMQWQGKCVLDMGAGTGVLGILADKMGATTVDAIDIDEWAFENMKENNARNETSMRMQMGGAELLGSKPKYDVILANINRNILTRDMANYARTMHAGALILFSGFYVQDEQEIMAAAQECGLEFSHSTSKEQWAMMVFQKQ
jgi:ribosomal protein L11 methyltransferase